MVNSKLANDLLSFGRPILVLGDPGQLPPINGEGAFMKGAPDVMLTQIHRQALESSIIEVATMARQGAHIPAGKYGNQVVKMRRADLTKQMLLRADQVICGLNKTRAELNLKMRNAAGVHQPLPCGQPGEKVICLENNYERGVLNGAFSSFRIFTTGTRDHSRRRSRATTARSVTRVRDAASIRRAFLSGSDRMDRGSW
jgi:exodeoxyribonuclease-5